VHTLVPNTPRAPLVETIAALCHLHRLAEVDFPLFVNDFHLKITFVLEGKAFIFALTRFLGLSSSGLSGMVYEFLWDYFVLNDLTSGFDFFFEICEHITHGHVLPIVSCLLVTFRLLSLEKQAKSI
jgi:hypothetical protein